ncbi:MSH4 (predicted) [Pycnogonum litorale]
MPLQYMFKEANFAIVTGPNMSGKSTYLRQVALMQVMAQIGMYVPAEYVSFRLTDQLFSRIGSADDMEANLSTFMLEMKETNYILQNITDKSLVIIDELGRGTSVEEGVGICWAVSEALIDKDAFVLFATHFMELAQLQAIYPNVTSLQFDVQADDGDEATGGQSIDEQRFRYTHVAKPGFTTAKHYGLRLAKMSTLPREVVNEAELIAQELESKVSGIRC